MHQPQPGSKSPISAKLAEDGRLSVDRAGQPASGRSSYSADDSSAVTPIRTLKAHLSLSPPESATTTSSQMQPIARTIGFRSKNGSPASEFETLYFPSQGTECEAWLMRPSSTGDVPLVIMAHGFAAEKRFGLLDYARKFVRRGLAVLMFDYRHFGGSGGEPRNLISVARQREDWQAAVDFAGTLPGIDQTRIGLWGTSFSGGHVLMCAAANQHICCVAAQAPMLDVLTSFRGYKPSYALKAIWHCAKDLFRAATSRTPHLVPVVSDGSKFAIMSKPGCEAGYRRIVPQTAEWSNSCPARVLLTSLFYRPGKKAWRVNCPTLLLLQAEDQ
ncbi:MAG TPA: CocE/NonD family hydrolase, partial [Pirellulales bacterium]